MSQNSKIEWTDHTFNPWTGCTKVSPGCDGCYAEAWSKRAGPKVGKWGPGIPRVRTTPANWSLPLRWNAQADAFMAQHGRRQRVFCASLADVFDNAVDPQWRVDLFNLILSTPNLDWLLLTKRIGNAARMIEDTLPASMKALPADHPLAWPWPNVWIGATITSQAEADRDIPKLLATPAAKRFLSMEPLLGPVDLTRIEVHGGDAEIYPLKGTTDCVNGEGEPTVDVPALSWVIVGGESGPGARPMHPDWARSLRDQCQAAGVPFLFKQWGEWICAGELRRLPGGGMPGFGIYDACRHDMTTDTVRVGKKAAGRRPPAGRPYVGRGSDMKERPILFSAPMVRALLAGTKTQTRRVVTLPRSRESFVLEDQGDGWWPYQSDDGESSMCNDGMEHAYASPYGLPGDRLWVRETHFAFGRWETRYSAKKMRDEWHFLDMTLECGHQYAYVADGYRIAPHRRGAGVTPCWWTRPAIFTPRRAGRILLEVTSVRVERLHDISEDDARAEGARECDPVSGREVLLAGPCQRGSFVLHYRDIWEQIYGAGGGDTRPWGWVVEFRRLVEGTAP